MSIKTLLKNIHLTLFILSIIILTISSIVTGYFIPFILSVLIAILIVFLLSKL